MRLFTATWSVALAVTLAAGAPALAQSGKKAEKKAAGDGASEKKAAGTGAAEKKPAQKKKASTEEKKKVAADLETQGTLGAAVKGEGHFYEFTYSVQDGKKKVAKKAWLQIDSGTALLADHEVGLEAFKEGEALMVFGKPVETDQGGKGAQLGGKFRNLQACRVVVGGKDVSVNDSYSDPKDKKFQWCEVAVEKPGPALTVTYGGASYRMSLDKNRAIIQRADGDAKKDLRKGAWVLVVAANSTDKPANDKPANEKPANEKEERPAFRALKVIVLEAKQRAWYGALLE